MASLDIPEQMPVPIQVWEGGAVRVGRTRVNLWQVVGHHLEGLSPEQIVEHYPTLELADVYGAIAYYLANREAVDAYLAEEERLAEEYWREYTSRPEYQAMASRLRARRDAARADVAR